MERGLDVKRNCECDPENTRFRFLFHPAILSTKIHCCPIKYITDQSRWFLEQYTIFRRLKHLPYKGGFYDQPNILIEAFMAMQSAIDKKEKIDEDKAERKRKRDEAKGKRDARKGRRR